MPSTIAILADSPEVKAAVDWWAKRLTQTNKQDSGDPELNLGMSLIRSMGPEPPFPSPAAVERFKECLTVAIAANCVKSWDVNNPMFGSAVRSVATDYGPDHTLWIALAAARIESGSLILPIKTVMRINPGCVKVSCGYGAKEEAIYGKEA